jgi:hypothetical protein
MAPSYDTDGASAEIIPVNGVGVCNHSHSLARFRKFGKLSGSDHIQADVTPVTCQNCGSNYLETVKTECLLALAIDQGARFRAAATCSTESGHIRLGQRPLWVRSGHSAESE